MAAAPASRNIPIDPAGVNGWGVDADPNNDPTYPYRLRSGQDARSGDWERPVRQRADVEILQSIEYGERPAVTGTTLPPKGVSGTIRRAAFGYSESDWRHWLLLLGADRVNVVEALFDDLAHGRVPNIPAELGMRAEWRHNRRGLVRKMAMAVGTAAVGYLIWQQRRARPGFEGRTAGLADPRRGAPSRNRQLHNREPLGERRI